MGSGTNVAVILEDDTGLFIRSGTTKYRPQAPVKGLRKGLTVRAWPWTGGMKVEISGQSSVWGKDA
jgi:hypothetical protein